MPTQFKNVLLILLAGVVFVWALPASAQQTVAKVNTTLRDNDQGAFDNQVFTAPEMIRVGELPLNTKARQMYPSPVMFDIDNDNRSELIVGDIFGSLNIYENQNESATGDPVWSNHVRLESTDGQPIKVSNW